MENTITFKKNSVDNQHYRRLKKEVDQVVKNLPKSRIFFKIGVTFFFILFYIICYLLALFNLENLSIYYILYSTLGIISVFIFLNIVHDAVHNHVFNNSTLNNIILFVFDLIGANSYVWKIRHIKFHHNYQNVMGWDSDIEQSGLIRVNPNDEPSWINRYQHRLIFFFYPLYLFNWVIVRDFKDFFSKKRILNKAVCKIPVKEYIKLFAFKGFFIFYTVILPIYLGQRISVAILALCLFLVTGGVFALFILLTPHVNIKNEFPLPNEQGELDNSWLAHQFITTNDIKLDNWFSRNLMGNFNFHLAHHIFPNVNSIYASEVTQVIRKYAQKEGFDYKSYTIFQALKYHYTLIKRNAIEFDIFEEDM